MASLVLHVGDHVCVSFDDSVHLVTAFRNPSTDWRMNEVWFACDKTSFPQKHITSITKAPVDCLECIAHESLPRIMP